MDSSPAKAHLCSQGGTSSLFLSGLSFHILKLADKHSITFIPAYIPTHLIVEADYLSQHELVPEWHLLPHIFQTTFQLLDQPQLDLLAASHTSHYQHYYTLEKLLPLGALGLVHSTILGHMR